MSYHAAVASTMEAVVRLMRASYDPAEFNGAVLDFQVYVSDDFNHPMEQGVSLFLYRIDPSGTARAPRGRLLPGGRQQRTKLPVDLHFLATAWARRASLQPEIAGWMMRALEKLTEQDTVEQLTEGNRVWYRLRDPGPPDGD
jgi:hypothetical protein